jgi:hypothetical protein
MLSLLARGAFATHDGTTGENRVLDLPAMASEPRALRHFFTAIALAALALPACHSTSQADDAGVLADADFVTCVGETRAPPFAQGMQVTSRNGTFVLKVLANTYTDGMGKVVTGKPAKGVDQWMIETDVASSSAPVDGLAMDVVPFMPDHGHGTSVAVAVTPEGSGTYLIAPLYLYMAGYWEITFDITDSSGATPVTDTAIVKVCVPD